MALRGSAPLAERALLSEFPFLPGAERLVEEMGVSVRALLEDPAFEHARELGRRRILAAVEDPTSAPGHSDLAVASAEERYLSFQYARLLLSTLPVRGALRRWAVAEAKGASARLGPGSVGPLGEVARRLGFGLEESGRTGRLPVADYLHLATPIREAEFRLIGQALKGGWVELRTDRAARLLQEGIRVRLSEPLELTDAVRGAIRSHEGPFLEEVARHAPAPSARIGGGVGPLLPDRFPPCIRKMRRVLEAGENLSHSGRFALAAFLHRAGAETETIVDAYRGAPDFDESVTRYQVEHITRRDEGRGYEPPECAKLRSHGLCVREGDPTAPAPVDRQRDALCFEERLRHPLQYYRIRGGSTRERDGPAPSDSGSVR